MWVVEAIGVGGVIRVRHSAAIIARVLDELVQSGIIKTEVMNFTCVHMHRRWKSLEKVCVTAFEN